MRRRSFLGALGALPFGGRGLPRGRRPVTGAGSPRVVVVGAGAFGGWTALYLLRGGAAVTLLDAWGPGNARASSGGETRVIRATYGSRAVYTRLTVRALALWHDHAARWRRPLFRPTGVLWMVSREDDAYERAALPVLTDAGMAHEVLQPSDLARRYPQIDRAGVRWAIYERDSGYLAARDACAAVVEGFVAEGGDYRQLAAQPAALRGNAVTGLTLSDGTTLVADRYVFACGPWLGALFPDVVGDRIRPTRQEVFFFGTPPGDARFRDDALPVWVDHGERFMYGIPGNFHRGFKIADDTHGPPFDPTTGDRSPTAEGVRAVRRYLGSRFPDLRDAPLLEARVCQYEITPDEGFLVDRHPAAGNAWLVGGGSGHGFKHGPALGELVAGCVLERRAPEPAFALARLGVPAPPRR
ncbi:MAG: FAD-dependent oxidoreductase [Gemmatimonadales bacterium]